MDDNIQSDYKCNLVFGKELTTKLRDNLNSVDRKRFPDGTMYIGIAKDKFIIEIPNFEDEICHQIDISKDEFDEFINNHKDEDYKDIFMFNYELDMFMIRIGGGKSDKLNSFTKETFIIHVTNDSKIIIG